MWSYKFRHRHKVAKKMSIVSGYCTHICTLFQVLGARECFVQSAKGTVYPKFKMACQECTDVEYVIRSLIH